MFLVNVHELEVVLADAVVLAALKHQVQDIRCVLGFERQNVLALSSSQHLGQRRQVDTEGNVAVASVGREAFGLEHHRHEGDVRVVHGLQGDARVIAVKVAVLDEILDGVDNLVVRFCRQRGLAGRGIVSIYLFQDAGLFQPCFQHFCHMLDSFSSPSERDHESIGRRQEGKRRKERGMHVAVAVLQYVLDRGVCVVLKRKERQKE